MVWAGSTWKSGFLAMNGTRYQKLTTIHDLDVWYQCFDFGDWDEEDEL